MVDHPDSLKSRIALLESEAKRAGERLTRWIRERQFWEGKFRIVKHENNQLRKKLRGA